MESFFAALLPKLEHLGWWSYWIVFFAAFLESLPLVGSFIPGTTIVAFLGFLASQGFVDFGDLLWFVGIGTFLGDFTSYRLAKQKTFSDVMERPALKKYEKPAKSFLEKYGKASIFIAKFVSHIRGIVAFLIGFTEMKPGKFIFFSLSSSFFWAVSVLSLGYFFGAAMGVVIKWMTRFSFFILILLITLAIAFFFYRVWIKHAPGLRLLRQTLMNVVLSRYLEAAEQAKTPFGLKIFYFVRKRLTVYRFSGLPFTFLLSGGVLLALGTQFSTFWFSRDEVQISDGRVANFLFEARDPSLTVLFKYVTFFGSAEFLLSLVVFVTVIFFLRKKIAESLALYSVFFAGSAFLAIMKSSVARPRPSLFAPLTSENPFLFDNSFSFPSGHMMLSTVVYGMIAYFVAQSFDRWRRKVLAAFSLGYAIFLIGLSRLYLGVHYLSDVTAGLFFGVFWLGFGIAMFEWLTRKLKTSA